ncbi:hypothetical protein FSARC_13883 [Fusarium sarcochroum]|uniref:Uncharacterized protein n=1 Tax=Fusarium sarcochroum TaxID=1208366 RepID=A0A8H4SXV8_9HYPO|nr:hypothetical protein FSARC_13883 [Fusarium sarcochroum]
MADNNNNNNNKDGRQQKGQAKDEEKRKGQKKPAAQGESDVSNALIQQGGRNHLSTFAPGGLRVMASQDRLGRIKLGIRDDQGQIQKDAIGSWGPINLGSNISSKRKWVELYDHTHVPGKTVSAMTWVDDDVDDQLGRKRKKYGRIAPVEESAETLILRATGRAARDELVLPPGFRSASDQQGQGDETHQGHGKGQDQGRGRGGRGDIRGGQGRGDGRGDSSGSRGRGDGRGRGGGRGGRRGGRGRGQGRGGGPGLAPANQTTCAECGSEAHDLMKCLRACANGFMRGCPRCNTLMHSAEQCIRLEKPKDKSYFLIQKRGNMPSFLDVKAIVDVVRQVPATKIPGRFPWTTEFTKSLVSEIPALQNDMDRLGLSVTTEGGFKLPVDPDMKDWDAVQATFTRLSSGSFVTPEEAEARMLAAREQVLRNTQARLEGERIAQQILEEDGEPDFEFEMEPVVGGDKDVDMEDADGPKSKGVTEPVVPEGQNFEGWAEEVSAEVDEKKRQSEAATATQAPEAQDDTQVVVAPDSVPAPESEFGSDDNEGVLAKVALSLDEEGIPIRVRESEDEEDEEGDDTDSVASADI